MENQLILINQKDLTITGIKKVLAVSETSITLFLESTNMNILGEAMEVKKIDVDAGILEVEGKINSIKYLAAKEKLSLLKRIFK